MHDRPENSRPDLHVVKHPGRKALSDWSTRCQQQGAGGQEQCTSHPGWSAIVRDSPFSQGLKRVLTISTLSARSPQMRGLFSHTPARLLNEIKELGEVLEELVSRLSPPSTGEPGEVERPIEAPPRRPPTVRRFRKRSTGSACITSGVVETRARRAGGRESRRGGASRAPT